MVPNKEYLEPKRGWMEGLGNRVILGFIGPGVLN